MLACDAMKQLMLTATAVLALGLANAWAAPKAIENMPKETPYKMPKPVKATAEAPESAAGKTLLFTYPKGAGIRSRKSPTGGKETPWPAWTKLVAATRGNYTFDAQNTYTTTSGGGGADEYRSTVTYKKISKGEALVTNETVGVGNPYKATTTYRLVFTTPTSGIAYGHTINSEYENEMTHIQFTLK